MRLKHNKLKQEKESMKTLNLVELNEVAGGVSTIGIRG